MRFDCPPFTVPVCELAPHERRAHRLELIGAWRSFFEHLHGSIASRVPRMIEERIAEIDLVEAGVVEQKNAVEQGAARND